MRWIGRLLFVLIGVMFRPATVPAQPAGLVFYNVDRLYDTLPSPFGYDADFLPEGRMRWTGDRYHRKVEQVAAVLDSLRMPLAGLYGVENEAVVRDLAAACRSDYAYLTATTDSYSGLDFALLYYGDRFFPGEVRAGHFWMEVAGRLDGEEVVLLFSASDRYIYYVVAEARERHPGARLLVAGRCAGVDPALYGLRSTMERARRAGRGDVRLRRGWALRNDILADTAFGRLEGEVYARRFLFDERGEAPLPTYSGERYTGGAGANLPLVCGLGLFYLEKP